MGFDGLTSKVVDVRIEVHVVMEVPKYELETPPLRYNSQQWVLDTDYIRPSMPSSNTGIIVYLYLYHFNLTSMVCTGDRGVPVKQF